MTPESLDNAISVRWLKDHSGLSWETLGKMFGVSARVVLNWANGGEMGVSSVAVLQEFSDIVRELDADRWQTRIALLTPGLDGYSIVDSFRRWHASGANDINRQFDLLSPLRNAPAQGIDI